MALHRPAEFNKSHIPAFLADETPRDYVSVYPFVRSYDWYLLPDEDRRRMLADHGKMARGYPDVRANTVASFSLGDYEWILAFEADELYRIVDLMRHLRASEARMHVREEVPVLHRAAASRSPSWSPGSPDRRRSRAAGGAAAVTGRRAHRRCRPALVRPPRGREARGSACAGRSARRRPGGAPLPADTRRGSRLTQSVRAARDARAYPRRARSPATEPDSRRRSSSAPSYGVAASRSAARISIGGSSPGPPVRTSRGRCRGAGQ